jgi:hypothetical protein
MQAGVGRQAICRNVSHLYPLSPSQTTKEVCARIAQTFFLSLEVVNLIKAWLLLKANAGRTIRLCMPKEPSRVTEEKTSTPGNFSPVFSFALFLYLSSTERPFHFSICTSGQCAQVLVSVVPRHIGDTSFQNQLEFPLHANAIGDDPSDPFL